MRTVISNETQLAFDETTRTALQEKAAEVLATDAYKGQHSGELSFKHEGRTYVCTFNRGSGVVDVVVRSIVGALVKAATDAVVGAVQSITKRKRNTKPSQKKAARRAKGGK